MATARESWWVPAAGIGGGTVAALVVVFMLGRPELYPPWTWMMMALVALFGLYYGLRDLKGRL